VHIFSRFILINQYYISIDHLCHGENKASASIKKLRLGVELNPGGETWKMGGEMKKIFQADELVALIWSWEALRMNVSFLSCKDWLFSISQLMKVLDASK
jgi:hypothetical protein